MEILAKSGRSCGCIPEIRTGADGLNSGANVGRDGSVMLGETTGFERNDVWPQLLR